ncbi:MAG TPA: 3-oxoacyl-ACP reductase FabG [Acidobacteriota bacterium]|nr:3-oxoacyl-ACP reductase FabG [Acidobacteriota bacterium]
MFELDGQSALVTGASRGIGRSIAEALAEAGAHVILAARSQEAVRSLAEDLRKRGWSAEGVEIDVGDPNSVRTALRELFDRLHRVEIVVNNAGIARDALLVRMKDEDWDDVLRTNLSGVFYVSREAVSRMLRQRYGRVINIASVVAMMGNPGQANYVASKAGIVGFTKALAREVSSRNITVNAVAPGFIETDMTARLSPRQREEMQRSIPLGRIGQPGEIACAVRFLASKEAGYITGHVLNINGGMYM